MFKRSAIAVVALTVLALGSAGVASATKPIRFGQPQPTFVSTCGSFDVLIELEGTEWITLLLDRDGNVTRVIGTYPQSKATVTNLDTGTSISFNLAGPLHVDVTAESEAVRYVGPWLVNWNPETGTPDEPTGWYLMRGQASFTFNGTGFSNYSFQGRYVDICAQLAD